MATNSATGVNGIVWEFQRNDGGFSPFPPQVSAEIEANHQAGLSTGAPIGHGQIDFAKRVMGTPRKFIAYL